MTGGFHQTQTRPSLISDFPRVFTAQEITGAPLANLAAFFKEGDMEHAFIPSCVPRPARMKQFCISLKYFSRSQPLVVPTARLVIARSTECDEPLPVAVQVDVTDVMTNQLFILNCFCGVVDLSFDVCDQFTVDLAFPGPSQPQSLLTRVVIDWELR